MEVRARSGRRLHAMLQRQWQGLSSRMFVDSVVANVDVVAVPTILAFVMFGCRHGRLLNADRVLTGVGQRG